MKLIFLDIDGTLTEPGATKPPESAAEAVRKARAAGNKVFLCTGRNLGMLSPLLPYGFDGYIASAGGYVVCGDKVLYDCPMTMQQRDTAMRVLHDSGVYRTIEALDASYGDEGVTAFLGSISGGNSELVRWRRAIEENLNIRPMAEYDGRPLYKVIVMCERPEQLAHAREALEGDFQFVMQDAFGKGYVNGELINRAFDKGRGVRRVAEALGVSLADTVGFGDSMNDLEMIETVGTSVCMENGSEELKSRSDLICPAVSADGLAQAFEQLHLI